MPTSGLPRGAHLFHAQGPAYPEDVIGHGAPGRVPAAPKLRWFDFELRVDGFDGLLEHLAVLVTKPALL